MIKHSIKGRVLDNILHKNIKQALKFFKHNGYGVRVADLHEVNGVLLDTKYDGRLYAPVSLLYKYGIEHTFVNKSGEEEKQLVMPVEYWREVR